MQVLTHISCTKRLCKENPTPPKVTSTSIGDQAVTLGTFFRGMKHNGRHCMIQLAVCQRFPNSPFSSPTQKHCTAISDKSKNQKWQQYFYINFRTFQKIWVIWEYLEFTGYLIFITDQLYHQNPIAFSTFARLKKNRCVTSPLRLPRGPFFTPWGFRRLSWSASSSGGPEMGKNGVGIPQKTNHRNMAPQNRPVEIRRFLLEIAVETIMCLGIREIWTRNFLRTKKKS